MPTTGQFGPHRPIWHLLQYKIIMFGGQIPLVYQLCHPTVAAGVDEHSTFRTDPRGRLERTVTGLLHLILGDDQAVAHTLENMRKKHKPVKGTIPQATLPPGASPRPYTADEDDAKRWVLATFLLGMVESYQNFVGPIHPSHREALAEDFVRVAASFKLDTSAEWSSWNAFQRWMDQQFQSVNSANEPPLYMSETTRQMCAIVFKAGLAWTPIDDVLAAQTLHPDFYRLLWGPPKAAHTFFAKCLLALARGVNRWLPIRFGWSQTYLEAMDRVNCTPRPLALSTPLPETWAPPGLRTAG